MLLLYCMSSIEWNHLWRMGYFLTSLSTCLPLWPGLFGEGPAERRERLRKLLAELGESAIQRKKEEKRIELKKKEQVSYTFSSPLQKLSFGLESKWFNRGVLLSLNKVSSYLLVSHPSKWKNLYQCQLLLLYDMLKGSKTDLESIS